MWVDPGVWGDCSGWACIATPHMAKPCVRTTRTHTRHDPRRQITHVGPHLQLELYSTQRNPAVAVPPPPSPGLVYLPPILNPHPPSETPIPCSGPHPPLPTDHSPLIIPHYPTGCVNQPQPHLQSTPPHPLPARPPSPPTDHWASHHAPLAPASSTESLQLIRTAHAPLLGIAGAQAVHVDVDARVKGAPQARHRVLVLDGSLLSFSRAEAPPLLPVTDAPHLLIDLQVDTDTDSQMYRGFEAKGRGHALYSRPTCTRKPALLDYLRATV